MITTRCRDSVSSNLHCQDPARRIILLRLVRSRHYPLVRLLRPALRQRPQTIARAHWSRLLLCPCWDASAPCCGPSWHVSFVVGGRFSAALCLVIARTIHASNVRSVADNASIPRRIGAAVEGNGRIQATSKKARRRGTRHHSQRRGGRRSRASVSADLPFKFLSTRLIIFFSVVSTAHRTLACIVLLSVLLSNLISCASPSCTFPILSHLLSLF